MKLSVYLSEHHRSKFIMSLNKPSLWSHVFNGIFTWPTVLGRCHFWYLGRVHSLQLQLQLNWYNQLKYSLVQKLLEAAGNGHSKRVYELLEAGAQLDYSNLVSKFSKMSHWTRKKRRFYPNAHFFRFQLTLIFNFCGVCC